MKHHYFLVFAIIMSASAFPSCKPKVKVESPDLVTSTENLNKAAEKVPQAAAEIKKFGEEVAKAAENIDPLALKKIVDSLLVEIEKNSELTSSLNEAGKQLDELAKKKFPHIDLSKDQFFIELADVHNYQGVSYKIKVWFDDEKDSKLIFDYNPRSPAGGVDLKEEIFGKPTLVNSTIGEWGVHTINARLYEGPKPSHHYVGTIRGRLGENQIFAKSFTNGDEKKDDGEFTVSRVYVLFGGRQP